MFVAYSPVLDLSTCGDSFDDATRNFQEALDLFFSECMKRGTLERALESFGWRCSRTRPPRWTPPSVVGETSLPIRLAS
ncbi:MAG: hypothetical protein HYY84_19685 [Deltaproteobacteria bacterium]|nr:hypothetical protein [Deltaproteobacteria bacterium]